MCGRYALALPPSRIRQRLDDSNMPSQDTPDDDDVRQSYNFAPGYYGLVYRADVPDHGAAGSSQRQPTQEDGADEGSRDEQGDDLGEKEQAKESNDGSPAIDHPKEPQFKLQAMKWGLVPFWTKRNPDYGTLMRTINCRDDSLAAPGGMWHTMKQKKRCIVIAQGFFEWLKKNEGKDKIPHYIRRKDGQLMCFAGLWDCVKYEGSEEKHYTYTIITTDANKQISFLHDRMPVILENGSENMFTWLDSNRSEWSRDLQALLKPYKGDLEIYPVTKDMNKTGTNSPNFIVPLNSAENKQNIANFFSSPKKPAGTVAAPGSLPGDSTDMDSTLGNEKMDINSETHAPPPIAGAKRLYEEATELKSQDRETAASKESPPAKAPKGQAQSSPSKNHIPISSKRSKNATSNATVSKVSPTKPTEGNKKITSFFGK